MHEVASVDPGRTRERNLVSTGISGLDDVLGGGLIPNRVYLLEGAPGAGKTTLSLQFLLDGVAHGESGLYIALSESAEELRAAAASHGWSLDAIDLHELVGDPGLDPESEQSILHPSDIELGETVKDVIAKVEALNPVRVVFDSLSELRLLAQSSLRYRRQILALKQFLIKCRCTVLLLDVRSFGAEDQQLYSVAHGVISLEQMSREYGVERRRLRIPKMRGVKFRGGYHDFRLETGGIRVFPRIVAAEHRTELTMEAASTGSIELDILLGGGLLPGTNTILIGPSGVGKSTTCVSCLLAAWKRGGSATYYLFDEGVGTFISRSAALGLDLGPALASGRLTLTQVDPAELSPGEFASNVKAEVEKRGSTFVVIDSLNAYLHALPDDKFLVLQMHELLTYLNQKGVITLVVLGQHGIVGEIQSDIDLSHLSDGIVLFRFFEAQGEVRTAVSVIKNRVSAHEHTIREFRLSGQGLKVGEALTDFQGILTGLPSYSGRVAMMNDGPRVPEDEA